MSIAATKAEISAPGRAGRRRYAVTRIATVGDQVLVAMANFGLTVAIGRAFAAEELASYGLGISVGLMVQAVQRHAFIIPLMLQPNARAVRRRGGIVAAHLAVLGCALMLGAAGLLAAHEMGASHYGRLIIAASAVCLIVYMQLEFSRAFLVKLGRPLLLFASAGWHAGVSTVLAVAALTHHVDYEMLLALLGSAMLLHALAVVAVARRFSLVQGLHLLAADLRRYGGWAVAATATYAGYNHAPLLILGALASPISAAAFVATRSLMQPLQVLLRGLDIADKSVFSENARTPHARTAFAVTVKLAALYAIIASVLGVAIGLNAERLIELAYGAKFAGFGPALIAWVPVFILLSVTMPFESLVYARQDFRLYYLVRCIASLVAVGLTACLVTRFAEVAAIAACGVGWLIAVAGTIMLLVRGTRS